MTTEEMTTYAAQLDNGDEINIEGTRIVAEGMDWCVTHPNGFFETVPNSGFERRTALDMIEWVDTMNNLALVAELSYPQDRDEQPY